VPGIVSSIFLIIVGAITRYAYSDSVWRWHSGGTSHSLRLDAIGGYLIIAGVVTLILSLIYNFLTLDTDSYNEYDEIVDKKPGQEPETYRRRRQRRRSL
jgi:formate hydrogenlyase subunit 3/multisubunit Na+/H+ antiporter MnhD subunit